MLIQRKQAAEISDSISKVEMEKNAGGDAAGALERVTGISVQDDKYVYVRGLGERYSNTTLNGSKLPTTEFDKKVVPLDLFPTKLLDNVRVAKTYSPDMSGDFAAGSGGDRDPRLPHPEDLRGERRWPQQLQHDR